MKTERVKVCKDGEASIWNSVDWLEYWDKGLTWVGIVPPQDTLYLTNIVIEMNILFVRLNPVQ